MPLSPSRRDTIGPPPSDVSNLAARVRHQGSYLRSLDPGIQEGRFATPTPVPKGPPRQLVGGDTGGDDTDYAWEFDDRATVTAKGTQTPRLSHIPIDETLHVFWHPKGHGGLRLTSEYFTVDDQIVTIPDPGNLWSVGDTFSFQYEYEISDDVVDLSVVGWVLGVPDGPTGLTLTFDPASIGMQAGDMLVIAARGSVAPGGGDTTLGLACSDSRVSQVYVATTPVVQKVWAGFATSTLTPVVVNVVPNPSYTPVAAGVMVVLRGVNDVGNTSAVEGGTTTPVLSGTATVAVTWDGNHSFTTVNADPPAGYTDIGDTGANYMSTDVSYWYDPAAESSPVGTFAGEGCLVIGLT